MDSTCLLSKPKRGFQLFFPLSLVPPAPDPEKSFKHNQLAVLLASIIIGIGGGMVYGSAAEFMDRSAKTTDDLSGATHISLLAPERQNEKSPISKIEKALKNAMDQLEGKNIIGAMPNKVRADDIPLMLYQR